MPYHFHAIQAPLDGKKIKHEVGVYQLPAIELGNGRWMTDSSKMTQWFEKEFGQSGYHARPAAGTAFAL